MGAFEVEALPAGPARALAEALEVLLAVVDEKVVFAGHVEGAVGLDRLHDFRHRVELLRLGEVSQITRVQHQGGTCSQGIDAGGSQLKRCDHVGVNPLAEPHVTIAELSEGKIDARVRRGRLAYACD